MIRVIVVSFLLALLVGCAAPIKYIPKTISIFKIDLTKYTKEDFLVTPYKYLGDYNSIGLLTAIAKPEAKLKTVNILSPDVSKDIVSSKEIWKFGNIGVEEVLDSLKKETRKMGGDAIVDFTINEISETYNTGSVNASVVTIYGYKISGFAIKRLGAFKPTADTTKKEQ